MATKARTGAGGFTLIELMIVVAVLSILASVAIPKYADMLEKAQEGSLKANLGAMRSALSIYYADNQGLYPSCDVGENSTVLSDSLVPNYLNSILVVNNTLHSPTNDVYCDFDMVAGDVHDGDGWYYDGATPADAENGSIWVACDHTDTIGSSWTSY